MTHELFHVQRRDWLGVLAEESLRTVLWFHPAIFWITSRIQLAREELVDELTVLATGNRKAYIEALLAFADAGGVRPAPAFARRRHLFTRILRLSKERVMSSRRIVVSSAVVMAAVLGTGWYASSVFPIVAAAPITVAPSSSTPLPSFGLPRYQVDRLVTYLAGQAGPSATAPRQSREAPAAVPQGARSGGAPRPGPVTAVAPAAPGTKPITPENPIPRRLSSVPVPYPASLRGSGYRGLVMLQVTLDASGSISDVRRMGVEVGGGDATIPRHAVGQSRRSSTLRPTPSSSGGIRRRPIRRSRSSSRSGSMMMATRSPRRVSVPKGSVAAAAASSRRMCSWMTQSLTT